MINNHGKLYLVKEFLVARKLVTLSEYAVLSTLPTPFLSTEATALGFGAGLHRCVADSYRVYRCVPAITHIF